MLDVSAFYELYALQSTTQPLSQWNVLGEILLEPEGSQEKCLIFEKLWGLELQRQVEMESVFSPDAMQDSSYMTDKKWN